MTAHGIEVEGTTRVVGIVGDPVDHSLSPRMHNAAYRALGLDYVYVPLRPSRRALADAVRAVKALGLAGVNVTVPFKEDVIRHVRRLTPTARAVGAVNTIYLDDGILVGDNTDSPGFIAALAAHGCRARAKRALVIGAGGAARAVVHGLLEAGAADVVVANRTPAKAKRLRREFPSHRTKLHAVDLEILDDFDFLAEQQLVVNSTSVGLHGGRFLDYDAEATPDDCIHFDLAYGEKPTAFLELAAAAGRPTIDGRHMLLHQGVLAFKLFTGRRAPVEVMADAIGIGGSGTDSEARRDNGGRSSSRSSARRETRERR
jgi:shikimate dehydrogenase